MLRGREASRIAAVSSEPKPSATVVPIRDAGSALEILLLQRSSRRGDKLGAWVFPGGKIEAADRAGAASDWLDAARLAAVRETHEEASLALEAESLVPISRWITPEVTPKRFDTWFFLGPVGPDGEVTVDGGEICDHRWLSPGAALEAYRSGEIQLAPPQFVTLTWLEAHRSVGDALRELGREPIMVFHPRICRTSEGACILYPGDAGYEDWEIERPGARHRLWALGEGWRYERD